MVGGDAHQGEQRQGLSLGATCCTSESPPATWGTGTTQRVGICHFVSRGRRRSLEGGELKTGGSGLNREARLEMWFEKTDSERMVILV